MEKGKGGKNWNMAAVCLCLQCTAESQAALETASFFRWSINTCKLTSSVRMGAPDSYEIRKKGELITHIVKKKHFKAQYVPLNKHFINLARS